jgi:transporter family protein
MYVILAIISAISAGFVSITIKIGLKDIDSNLGTFLRTLVVIIFAAIMTAISDGYGTLANMTWVGWVILTASGIFTALSWVFGYKALQVGVAHKVIVIDKLSTILTMALAIVILSEPFWWLTFVAMALILLGSLLMVIPPDKTIIYEVSDIKDNRLKNKKSHSWILFAVLALVFASFTAILSSIGMNAVFDGTSAVNSSAATLYRTIIVAILSLSIVLSTKKMGEIKMLTKRNWLFIILSGGLTGVSWLAFLAAIQLGSVSVVVPIDKLSIIISTVGAALIFKEKISWRGWLGLGVLTTGTMLLLIPF